MVKEGVAKLRPGGVVVLVGCVTPDTQLGLAGDTLVRGCATIIGVHNYHHADLHTAVQESQNNTLLLCSIKWEQVLEYNCSIFIETKQKCYLIASD